MNAIVFPDPDSGLTMKRYASVISEIAARLDGRVNSAFVFGSAGTAQMTRENDIDLILVVNEVDGGFFWHRALALIDLSDIHPKLDILVYTPDELTNQLADSEVGFWRSVRESMRQIV